MVRSPLRTSIVMNATWFLAPSTTSAKSTFTPSSFNVSKPKRPSGSDPNRPAYAVLKPSRCNATIAVAVCPPADCLCSRSRIFVSKAGYSGTTIKWSTAFNPKPTASKGLFVGRSNGKCMFCLLLCVFAPLREISSKYIPAKAQRRKGSFTNSKLKWHLKYCVARGKTQRNPTVTGRLPAQRRGRKGDLRRQGEEPSQPSSFLLPRAAVRSQNRCPGRTDHGF